MFNCYYNNSNNRSYLTFLQRVFSECTEANDTSLIPPLDNILPEICDFIISFSCTVKT